MNDFSIMTQSNQAGTNMCAFGATYLNPNNRTKIEFGGGDTFQVKEIEVYQVYF